MTSFIFMRRRLVPLISLLAVMALAHPGAAGAADGGYFPGDALDGPSADIQRLGDLDVARDGTGALAYVKREGGVDHIFVSRLVAGAWQAPERVDGGLAGVGAQPVVACTDGGRLAVAFVSGGAIYTVVRPAGGAYTAPTLVAAAGDDPALDMSINGVAYLTFTDPSGPSTDVRAARLERDAVTFNLLADRLDIDPARDAGRGDGRSKVAIAADGIATVVWGEAGHVFGRRIYEARLSTAPQDLNVAEIGGQPGGDADRPDVEAEDDSSFAWVVFRQLVGGVPRALGRRLVGSQFEAPVVIDGGEAANVPRIAMNGRGVGYAATAGASGVAYGAVLKDDILNAGVALGGGGVPSLPMPAVAETGDGLVAFEAADRTLHARAYDYIPASRAVTPPGPDLLLSRPELGPVDAGRGLLGAGNRVGDIALAFAQGEGAGRHVVVAAFDRMPGTFRVSATRGWRKPRPQLRWTTAFDLWGPLTYEVQVDGLPNGQTTAAALRVPNAVPDGVHRWRVVAIDRRGQRRATRSRMLRIDGKPPTVSFKVSGVRKPGALVKVTVKASDASGTRAKASGLERVRVSFGDGSRAVVGKRARHRYRRGGARTIRVTAVDRAGNVTVVKRRVRIRR